MKGTRAMNRIVLNQEYGGPALSPRALALLHKMGLPLEAYSLWEYGRPEEYLALRMNPILIEVILEIRATDEENSLDVFDLPRDVRLSSLYIEEYDGYEILHEGREVPLTKSIG